MFLFFLQYIFCFYHFPPPNVTLLLQNAFNSINYVNLLYCSFTVVCKFENEEFFENTFIKFEVKFKYNCDLS